MSSSNSRLAVVIAAGHHASITSSDANQQMSLKSASRGAHANMILTSFFLGCVLVVSCMCVCLNYCCKSKKRRRCSSSQGKMLRIPSESPNLDSSVYTLSGECPHRMQYCEASIPPPYRRPPTPGPPPAYDSVVSKHSKYRKFGDVEDASDDETTNENNQAKHLIANENIGSISGLNKLRKCRIHGNCSLYSEDDIYTEELLTVKIDKNDMTNKCRDNVCKALANSITDVKITIDIDELNSDDISNHHENYPDIVSSGCQKINGSLGDHETDKHEHKQYTDEKHLHENTSEQLLVEMKEQSSNNDQAMNANPNISGTSGINVIQENFNSDFQILPSYEDALAMSSKK